MERKTFHKGVLRPLKKETFCVIDIGVSAT